MSALPEKRKTNQPRRVPVASAVFAAFIVLSVGGITTPASAEGQEWLPSEPLKGRMVFEQKHCNTCHSIGGAGGTIGPDLADESFEGSFLDLASSLWNHIPDMVVEQRAMNLDWPTFSDDEITHLISYLYYLRYLGTPGHAENGKKLFRAKGCRACHSVGGEGDADAGPKLDSLIKYASPIYMIQSIWNHGPEMEEQIRDFGIDRPRFDGQEIADLAAYIRSISQLTVQEKIYMSPGNPRAGRHVFDVKGCVQCHAADDSGGDIGPALDDVDLNQSVTEIAAMMWNHADEMRAAMGEHKMAWPTFEGKEMADLIAYLYFINFMDPPGNEVRGNALFQERMCSSCHAINGVGGDAGPDLADVGDLSANVTILRAMFNHAEKMSQTVLSEGKTWPVLTGPEMRDIFAYLSSVNGDI
jgi:mono/diheme cytochrome c family protein